MVLDEDARAGKQVDKIRQRQSLRAIAPKAPELTWRYISTPASGRNVSAVSGTAASGWLATTLTLTNLRLC